MFTCSWQPDRKSSPGTNYPTQQNLIVQHHSGTRTPQHMLTRHILKAVWRHRSISVAEKKGICCLLYLKSIIMIDLKNDLWFISVNDVKRQKQETSVQTDHQERWIHSHCDWREDTEWTSSPSLPVTFAEWDCLRDMFTSGNMCVCLFFVFSSTFFVCFFSLPQLNNSVEENRLFVLIDQGNVW